MSNILAIAHRELRSYFVSPIAYVVVGLFALLYGYFYIASLAFMVQFSSQAGMFGGGPQTININEFMVRPLLSNTAIILLFILPFLTARAYAEEKRSGTIELLLTSPLRDMEIILGKFLGALALFLLMLAVTAVHMGILFWYGEPELGSILSGYLGLALMGGSFIALGLLVSSATRNQVVAGVGTFSLLLLFWVLSWMSDSAGPTAGAILSYLSILEHFDDFSKGVIDTGHVAYYLSFIAFGLFLTAKSVDSERWRG
jgi:ABC-2 type transport system permease protein